MRIREIVLEDGVSYETTIRGIIAVLGSRIGQLYHQLEQTAEQHYAKHSPGDKDTWSIIKSGVTSRWMGAYWHDALRKDLEDLAKYKRHQCADLKQFLGPGTYLDMGATQRLRFNSIEAHLPEILEKAGARLKEKRIRHLASEWIRRRDEFADRSVELKKQAEIDRTPSKPKPKAEPKANLGGKQSAQANAIVDHVLGNLPQKIASEIRAAIARSDNRLLALQKEMAARNIQL